MQTNPPPPETPQPRKVFHQLDRCAAYPYARSEYVRRILWNLVQATLFRWTLPRANRFRCFLLRMFGAKLDTCVTIRRTVRIWHPWLLEMQTWTCLADNVEVYNLGKVTIEQHTVISQGAYLCAGSHDYSRPNLPLVRPEIRIGAGVWVCAMAFIGPGAKIGDNTVIGACSVVTGEVPPGVVAAGNPLRVIKPRPMQELR